MCFFCINLCSILKLLISDEIFLLSYNKVVVVYQIVGQSAGNVLR